MATASRRCLRLREHSPPPVRVWGGLVRTDCEKRSQSYAGTRSCQSRRSGESRDPEPGSGRAECRRRFRAHPSVASAGVEPGGLACQVGALGEVGRPSGARRRTAVPRSPGRRRRSQVRRHRGVAGRVGVQTRERRRRPRGPSAAPTATARLSRTTGLSVRRASSSYHSTICTQSVSPAVGASAWSAATAAWAWNSPSRSRARAACSIPTPSAIDSVSHRPRSCSASGTTDCRRARSRRPAGRGGAASGRAAPPPQGGRSRPRAAGSAGWPRRRGRRRRSSPRWRPGKRSAQHRGDVTGAGRTAPRRRCAWARLMRCAMVASGTR